MTLSLYAHTVALLRDRPRDVTLKQIAACCDVSVEWLAMIQRNERNPDHDPGVKKIQKLYEYLSGKPLLADNAQ